MCVSFAVKKKMNKFFTKIKELQEKNNTKLCIGLDFDFRNKNWKEIEKLIYDTCYQTEDLVCAYKINIAFFSGIQYINDILKNFMLSNINIPIICDGKYGDIEHVAKRYAYTCFEYFGFDAVTVNPYMGSDVIKSFSEYKDKGIFVLAKTTNPSADEIQKFDNDDCYVVANKVIDIVSDINKNNNLGLVYSTDIFDDDYFSYDTYGLPILFPGIGTQGKNLQKALKYKGLKVISVSRDIINTENIKERAKYYQGLTCG